MSRYFRLLWSRRSVLTVAFFLRVAIPLVVGALLSQWSHQALPWRLDTLLHRPSIEPDVFVALKEVSRPIAVSLVVAFGISWFFRIFVTAWFADPQRVGRLPIRRLLVTVVASSALSVGAILTAIAAVAAASVPFTQVTGNAVYLLPLTLVYLAVTAAFAFSLMDFAVLLAARGASVADAVVKGLKNAARTFPVFVLAIAIELLVIRTSLQALSLPPELTLALQAAFATLLRGCWLAFCVHRIGERDAT